jgi:hypothetical protein
MLGMRMMVCTRIELGRQKRHREETEEKEEEDHDDDQVGLSKGLSSIAGGVIIKLTVVVSGGESGGGVGRGRMAIDWIGRGTVKPEGSSPLWLSPPQPTSPLPSIPPPWPSAEASPSPFSSGCSPSSSSSCPSDPSVQDTP